MKLPFTVEQFMEVFKSYNTSVFPMQVVFYLLAIAAICFSINKTAWSGKVILIILSFFWLWMGVAYHLLFFTTINKAAYQFGGAYILESILLLYYAFSSKNLTFHFRVDTYGLIGGIIILFALVIYPFTGYYAGHVYPASPTFGLPCPTTIFTFGLLLWMDKPCPVAILIIPFLWSIVGSSAAVTLGMYEDTGLLLSGLVATSMIALRNRKGNVSRIAHN